VTQPFAERLTMLDATFLAFEDENVHMHVASLSTFDARPLTTEDGGLDFGRIEKVILQMLHRNPRMRQKVWWPTGGPPMWIDDADFRLSYHLRQTALPLPGDARQLKRLAGRVMSQTLDLTKPLWEIWVVEGVEGGERFAMLAKLHHCLADGIAARDILTGYLGIAPSSATEVVAEWRPRPAPGLARLALESIKQRADGTRRLSHSVRQLFGQEHLRDSLAEAAGSMLGALSSVVTQVSHTPLNRRIGPHRRFDWTRCNFEAVKRIRKASGGKVNDVVLACVCGALRSFLLARKLSVDELDFRIMVPVNVRNESQDGSVGNRVSNMTVPIPLFETDPRRRLKRIIATTSRIKASRQSQVGELVTQLADSAGIFLPRPLARRASRQMAANLVVTNVPGPMFPMYLLESSMLDSFPMVPLAANQALGIALYTYNGYLHWGFNADWDVVPDLHDLVTAIDSEFAQLVEACSPLTLPAEARNAERLEAPATVPIAAAPAPQAPAPQATEGEAPSRKRGETSERPRREKARAKASGTKGRRKRARPSAQPEQER